MWIILGVFIQFVTTLLPFYVLFFWLMPVPQLEIKLAPPTVEGKVLTLDQLGSPLTSFYINNLFKGDVSNTVTT